jgi:ABC-type glutathione transport system ATPase component
VAARTLLDLIASVVRRRALALMLMTRDHRALAGTTNDLLVLHKGRIVESGTPGGVFARPQHQHAKDLLAAGKVRTRTLAQPPVGTDLLNVRGLVLAGAAEGADIDFGVRRGEALAIIGRAGGGQSQVARIVAGLERATKGLLVYEHDSYHGSDLPPHRRREIGFAFADPKLAFSPHWPVGSSLTEPLHLEPQLLMEEQAQRLIEMVRAVGLEPGRLSDRPAAFSTDELLRLGLARALMARPRLLVLNDPVSGLDVLQRAEMLTLVSRLRSDYGLTVLLALDDLEVARVIADRALILEGGRIVETGKPADLVAEPRHGLTQALVRALPPEVGALPDNLAFG